MAVCLTMSSTTDSNPPCVGPVISHSVSGKFRPDSVRRLYSGRRGAAVPWAAHLVPLLGCVLERGESVLAIDNTLLPRLCKYGISVSYL